MKKEHILVIRFSAMGDVAMTVPVVLSVARKYPDVRITVLSRAFARTLFEGLAPSVGFMEADLKHEYHGIKGLNALYRRLAAKQFTAIADLHNVLRSEYLRLRFHMGHYRIAHIDKHRKGRRQLTSPDKKVLVQQPTAFQNYADVFARLGYPVDVEFTSIFPEGGGDITLLSDSLQALLATPSPAIGLAPFAAHKGKTYPTEQTRQVVAGLVEKYPEARLFLFGRGQQEEELFAELCQQYGQCVFVANHTETLREELILMSHLDVMMSMDSANMHLASLVGTPVVSVWGATHPFAGFMGWQQKAENAVQTDLSCRPCSAFGQKPCLRRDYACLTGIAPQTIIDKIDSVLNKAD